MAVPLIQFSWTAQPSPLPAGASQVDHFVLSIKDSTGKVIFTKTLNAGDTSYVTTQADNIPASADGSSYTAELVAVDAAGQASEVAGVVSFQVVSPPRPYSPVLSVGTITWG